jgi:hypothetical protein
MRAHLHQVLHHAATAAVQDAHRGRVLQPLLKVRDDVIRDVALRLQE